MTSSLWVPTLQVGCVPWPALWQLWQPAIPCQCLLSVCVVYMPGLVCFSSILWPWNRPHLSLFLAAVLLLLMWQVGSSAVCGAVWRDVCVCPVLSVCSKVLFLLVQYEVCPRPGGCSVCQLLSLLPGKILVSSCKDQCFSHLLLKHLNYEDLCVLIWVVWWLIYLVWIGDSSYWVIVPWWIVWYLSSSYQHRMYWKCLWFYCVPYVVSGVLVWCYVRSKCRNCGGSTRSLKRLPVMRAVPYLK